MLLRSNSLLRIIYDMHCLIMAHFSFLVHDACFESVYIQYYATIYDSTQVWVGILFTHVIQKIEWQYCIWNSFNKTCLSINIYQINHTHINWPNAIVRVERGIVVADINMFAIALRCPLSLTRTLIFHHLSTSWMHLV